MWLSFGKPTKTAAPHHSKCGASKIPSGYNFAMLYQAAMYLNIDQ
jgi:hypothetical protein